MLLHGVIPANILPFDVHGDIDEEGYRHHLRSLLAVDGVTGLTCNGHAAEVSSLTEAERHRALRIAVETAEGRVPVVTGVFAAAEEEAIAFAREAAGLGADALLMFPPECLRHDADPAAAYRYFAAVADAVGLPMVAFMYPAFTGLQYAPGVLERLCTIDHVVAVKEWSLDIAVYERTRDVVRAAGHEIALLTSFSTHLLPSLVLGADGILSGHGSVIADLQAQLFRAVRSGDLVWASAVYERIQKLTPVVYADPLPNMYARMKEQLAMLGMPYTTKVRPPLRPVTADERARLWAALESAGVLPVGHR